MIDSVPKGFRSAVIQSALADYMESETYRTLLKNLNPEANLTRQTITTDSQEKGNVFTQLTGDF
jgi:hypothetical protein